MFTSCHMHQHTWIPHMFMHYWIYWTNTVQILLDPTLVPAIEDLLEMVTLVLMILSVKMDHINVQLMQHALTLLAHILVPVILVTLGMEQLVLI